MDKKYETERLVLKSLIPKDALIVLKYYEQNRDFLKTWEAQKDESFFTLEHHQKILAHELKEMEQGRLLRLWLFKKEDYTFEKTIGTIGFSNIVRGAFQSCFLGYKLHKEVCNQGYMTEAVRKGREIIFNEYQMHRIEANIMPKNKASLRVVEKLDFINEGISKKYLRINGKWEDHIHMVYLNENME